MTFLKPTQRPPQRRVFSIKLLEKYVGYISFETNDPRFLNECGGHRWQRVPPTERNGRVHTSTVTVACLNSGAVNNSFDEKKVIVEYFKSGGPGGQNKNKVETACRLKYGDVVVTNSDQRSKRQNFERAMSELKRRVIEAGNNKVHNEQNLQRQNQIGSGQRGDKIRTYRERDNIVICHKSNRKFNYDKIMNGDILSI